MTTGKREKLASVVDTLLSLGVRFPSDSKGKILALAERDDLSVVVSNLDAQIRLLVGRLKRVEKARSGGGKTRRRNPRRLTFANRKKALLASVRSKINRLEEERKCCVWSMSLLDLA